MYQYMSSYKHNVENAITFFPHFIWSITMYISPFVGKFPSVIFNKMKKRWIISILVAQIDASSIQFLILKGKTPLCCCGDGNPLTWKEQVFFFTFQVHGGLILATEKEKWIGCHSKYRLFSEYFLSHRMKWYLTVSCSSISFHIHCNSF